MPVYECACDTCGKYQTYYRKMAESDQTPECCGKPASKVIFSAPMVRPDIAPWMAYESPASGKMITSYAERRADQKATGTRDYEGFAVEKKYADQVRAEEQKALDKSTLETAERVYESLSPQKKAALLAGV